MSVECPNDAGSSVTELKTLAKPEGDDFIVNGNKVFGTHSAEAKLFLIYLRFAPGIDGIGSQSLKRVRLDFRLGRHIDI